MLETGAILGPFDTKVKAVVLIVVFFVNRSVAGDLTSCDFYQDEDVIQPIRLYLQTTSTTTFPRLWYHSRHSPMVAQSKPYSILRYVFNIHC